MYIYSRTFLSKLLKQHLENNECHHLLKEYAEKKSLSDGLRRVLVNEAVTLLRAECSNYPTKNEQNAMALAITSLFPNLKSDTGQNIFFDAATNTGYLVSRLKNLNFKRKKLNRFQHEENDVAKVSLPSLQQSCLTEGDIEFFKNCVLPQQRSALEERLKKTVKERAHMCANGANIHDSFPFFFVDTELVTDKNEVQCIVKLCTQF
ncbi:uncharacterized protein LOC118734202 [Rhagoletis pomonella]|uniref:uncharacterized protein LOC118734202 n=1 Tax=Rhagoletis pomonella TaxID=28610 RepID=UPI001784A644|nr:uncharacterized protein LOC118734202 [Rhagoletis pomonella]